MPEGVGMELKAGEQLLLNLHAPHAPRCRRTQNHNAACQRSDQVTLRREEQTMPLYEYVCGRCTKSFDELVSQRAATPACPTCAQRGEVTRVLFARLMIAEEREPEPARRQVIHETAEVVSVGPGSLRPT
jgi:putative FmdB family regulatory protein